MNRLHLASLKWRLDIANKKKQLAPKRRDSGNPDSEIQQCPPS